jgi:HAD-hyrolase-like
VRVGIVSDIHFDLRPAFADAGLADLVDSFVLSFEHGVQKPNPQIFRVALERLAVEPAETLMVGDRASHDGAAVELGIPTVLVPPLKPRHIGGCPCRCEPAVFRQTEAHRANRPPETRRAANIRFCRDERPSRSRVVSPHVAPKAGWRSGTTLVDGAGRITVPRQGESRHFQKRGPSVASYRRTAECLGFFMRSVGSLSPLVQRFGISPHLDGVDAFTIHPVGGDGDVNAPIELAGVRDEATETGDVAVPILGIHEFVASDDDHVSPQGGRVRCARSVWKREVTRRLGVTELLDHATAADPGHVHAENGLRVGRPEAVAPPNGGPVAI